MSVPACFASCLQQAQKKIETDQGVTPKFPRLIPTTRD
jgi:hypothetical protein